MHGPTRTDAHRSEESLTVLVVDDDEDDFALVRSLLEEADGRYAPTWVRDGASAVDLLRAGPFDAVLCDFRLGDRNGIEVLREIRELGVPTPVILLTGWGGRDVDLLAMRAGAADYLDKNGLTAELLDRSIRYAVEHATLLEALRESEARYELLAREVDEGLWEWDLATDVARYSPRWLRLLDLEPGEVADTPQAFFARIHPDDHDVVRAHIDAHLGGGTGHFAVDHRIRNRDGSYRWVRSHGEAIRARDGRPLRLAAAMKDLGERRPGVAAALDPVTGLPDRRALIRRLDRITAARGRDDPPTCAVLACHVGAYDLLVGARGHDAADRFLAEVAARLQGAVRDGDMVARLEGPAFGVLLEGIPPGGVAAAARRLVAALDQPVTGPPAIAPAPSVGYAVGGEPGNPPELLRRAMAAMQEAVTSGPPAVVAFDGDHRGPRRALAGASALLEALEAGQVLVYYQPIVDLADGRVVAFEALIRLPGRRRVLEPAEFLPSAEALGVSVRSDLVVADQALERLAAWRRRTGDDRLSLHLNLSPRHFTDRRLTGELTRLLSTHGLPTSSLVVEITEGLLLEASARPRTVLEDLREAGIRVYLDDFGTGYSSLGYLHELPVAGIKIDRTFVAGIGPRSGSTIARTIVRLAGDLGLELVAEGVETAAQETYLRAAGCRYGQGFRFGTPLPAADAAALLGLEAPGPGGAR